MKHNTLTKSANSHRKTCEVRMAERSKALRSGRSPLLWAWVRIPLLTNIYFWFFKGSNLALVQYQ